MNKYIIFLSLISGLSTILGNLILFIPCRNKNKILSYSFGLTFIIMVLISIIELIPNAFKYGINIDVKKIAFLSLIAIYITNKLSNILDNKIKATKYLKIGYKSGVVLFLHNVLEGLISCMTIKTTQNYKFLLLIIIHNIPEGVTTSLPIYYDTNSKTKAFITTLVSGLGEVIGSIITICILYKYLNNITLYITLISTAYIMTKLSIEDILINAIKLKQYKSLIYGIISGILVVLLTI